VQLPNEEKPFPVGERTKRGDLRRPGVNSCYDRALEARGEERVESEDSDQEGVAGCAVRPDSMARLVWF
jgi:hypothetical protein